MLCNYQARKFKGELFLKKLITLSLFLSFFAEIRAEEFYTKIKLPAEEKIIYSFGSQNNNVLPSGKFKILVWNIHKASEEGFYENFIELIADKDIVVSQEMFLDNYSFDFFSSFADYHYTTATSFLIGNEEIKTGLITGAKVLPKIIKHIRTDLREPVLGTPKMSLITRYPLENSRNLTIVNVHSINFVNNEVFSVELYRIYNLIKNYPPPIIFTGDFNTWNKFRTNLLNKIKEKLNLREASFYPDKRMRFNGFPLDHFFHSQDIKLLSAKSIDIYRGSDHRPLELEIELR